MTSSVVRLRHPVAWLDRGALYCGVGFALYAAVTIRDWWGLATFSSLLVSFAIGYFIRETRNVWIAYCIFLVANLALILASAFDQVDFFVDVTNGVYGNPNYLGCALALGVAAALGYRMIWLAPPFLYAIWLTQSRTAMLGAGVALAGWAWRSYKTTAFTFVAAALIGILLSSHGESSIWQRVGIWQDTLNHLTIFGQGFGSFYEAYWAFPVHTNIGFLRAGHAYNDYLELIFELGIGSMLLWIFIARVLSTEDTRLHLILYTYFALALTYFPLFVWPIGQLVAFTLGHLTKEARWQL